MSRIAWKSAVGLSLAVLGLCLFAASEPSRWLPPIAATWLVPLGAIGVVSWAAADRLVP